jgi:hypothetical protein
MINEIVVMSTLTIIVLGILYLAIYITQDDENVPAT